MNIFGTEIRKEDMPSYQTFKNSPNHLYSQMQDVLNNALSKGQMINNDPAGRVPTTTEGNAQALTSRS